MEEKKAEASAEVMARRRFHMQGVRAQTKKAAESATAHLEGSTDPSVLLNHNLPSLKTDPPGLTSDEILNAYCKPDQKWPRESVEIKGQSKTETRIYYAFRAGFRRYLVTNDILNRDPAIYDLPPDDFSDLDE